MLDFSLILTFVQPMKKEQLCNTTDIKSYSYVIFCMWISAQEKYEKKSMAN